jgi:purine-binding chemotaxis protein CheW
VERDARHVLFRAGGERFALPLASVNVVVPPDPPFALVPRTGPPVLGAMGLRGRVVAVVEMAPLLGLPAAEPGATGQVIVLERDRRALGFLVDGVIGVEPVDEPERRGDAPPVRGLSSLRGSPVTVLDPDALAEAAQALFRGRAG